MSKRSWGGSFDPLKIFANSYFVGTPLASVRLVDFLENHMHHNHTEEKAARVKARERLAFGDPSEWQPYNLWCIQNLETMMEGAVQK